MTYRRTDYERIAPIYDSGRALPLEWLEAWLAELYPFMSRSGTTVVDVGSGTGLWTEALGDWFNVRMIAVEPSEAMRRAAATKDGTVGAWLMGGTAERLPLRTGACDCAWLSTVLHHIADVPACVAELHRVLGSGGLVLIRNSFGDRLDGINWLKFFPAARDVARRRWPHVDPTADTFRAGGFVVEKLVRVPEIVAADMRAYLRRIEVRANSTLTMISDEDFEDGLRRLWHAAERETAPAKVVDLRDLLVLRKAD